MVGLETVLVKEYEVEDITDEETQAFSHWDAAEKYYEARIERYPKHIIRLVAVVCENF